MCIYIYICIYTHLYIHIYTYTYYIYIYILSLPSPRRALTYYWAKNPSGLFGFLDLKMHRFSKGL